MTHLTTLFNASALSTVSQMRPQNNVSKRIPVKPSGQQNTLQRKGKFDDIFQSQETIGTGTLASLSVDEILNPTTISKPANNKKEVNQHLKQKRVINKQEHEKAIEETLDSKALAQLFTEPDTKKSGTKRIVSENTVLDLPETPSKKQKISIDNIQFLEVIQKFNTSEQTETDKNTLSEALSKTEIHTPQKEKYSPETQALNKINDTLDETKPETLTAKKKTELANNLKKQELDQVLLKADLPALFVEPKPIIKAKEPIQEIEKPKIEKQYAFKPINNSVWRFIRTKIVENTPTSVFLPILNNQPFSLNPSHRNLISQAIRQVQTPKITASVNNAQLLSATKQFSKSDQTETDKKTLETVLSKTEIHIPAKKTQEYNLETQAFKKINDTFDETKPETLTAEKKTELADILNKADLSVLFAEPEQDINVKEETKDIEAPQSKKQPTTMMQMFKNGFNTFGGGLSSMFSTVINFFKQK
jgi:hypothetical protein